MKKLLLFIFILTGLLLIVFSKMYSSKDEAYTDVDQQSSFNREIRNGDIIFQISKSSQSLAIQLASKSKYSHVGIIFKNKNKYFVFEATRTVKLTPLGEWIKKGEKGHFVIKRLKFSDKILTDQALTKMRKVGERFKNKLYDSYFEWSDDKMYCSELVWKIYKESLDIEIGKVQKLSEFDLSSKIVRSKLTERYGNNIPMNEKVISPAAMFNSTNLILIQKN